MMAKIVSSYQWNYLVTKLSFCLTGFCSSTRTFWGSLEQVFTVQVHAKGTYL